MGYHDTTRATPRATRSLRRRADAALAGASLPTTVLCAYEVQTVTDGASGTALAVDALADVEAVATALRTLGRAVAVEPATTTLPLITPRCGEVDVAYQLVVTQ